MSEKQEFKGTISMIYIVFGKHLSILLVQRLFSAVDMSKQLQHSFLNLKKTLLYLKGLGLWCLTQLSTIFNFIYIVAVSFSGGGKAE